MATVTVWVALVVGVFLGIAITLLGMVIGWRLADMSRDYE